MASARDNLIDWLRDAHAMEEQAEQMMTATSKRLENYPELRARLEQHIEETRQQAAQVRGCLDRLGGTDSTVKNLAGRATAFAQGLSGLFVSDEVVKAMLASYTFEHMEIASYRILIVTAEEVGDAETVRVCQAILAQEEAMAQWLQQQMGKDVRRFLRLADTPGATAKH